MSPRRRWRPQHPQGVPDVLVTSPASPGRPHVPTMSPTSPHLVKVTTSPSQVLGTPGNNLHEVETAEGARFLVTGSLLPPPRGPERGHACAHAWTHVCAREHACGGSRAAPVTW
uniref:Uncharacterized protein n=1 Tax=Apteryx owenii TaxID=8824 RepID=A0A8B9P3T5_APTOW